MRKVLNVLILLVLVGALLFLGWRTKLIPNPFGQGPNPDTTPTPNIVTRDQLRVAVAQRPEKLLITSLQRLLEVDGLRLELVEYNPETVWLELASQELDLVIAPLGEAVQAQGRFDAGRFLFFSGLSVGLDQLLANPKSEKPGKVAVARSAATDFLARRMLPEATVVPAQSLAEVEAWLQGGAVDAALTDTSVNSAELASQFKVLVTTSPEDPMPTVAVLSRDFAKHADQAEYKARRDILFAALSSWARLVGYLESQPELLRTALKREADAEGIEIDSLLTGYTFLAPSPGRAMLEDYQKQGYLKRTLDLLALSGVNNLSAPDWNQVVQLPAILEQAFSQQVALESSPSPLPAVSATPAISPTPQASPGAESPPSASPTPAITAPVQPSLPATFNYLTTQTPVPWPAPTVSYSASASLSFAPALSLKQVAVPTETALSLHNWSKESVNPPLPSEPTTHPLSDGHNFFVGIENRILAFNSSGKTVWEFECKGKPLACITVVAGHLVYALDEGDRGRIVCLDVVDGENLWEAVTPAPPASNPVAGSADGAIVISLDQAGQVRAWDLKAGTLRWEKKLKTPIYLNPSTGYGRLALTEPGGTVRFLSLLSGEELWNADLGTSIAASATVTPSGVLVPAKDTYLYNLDSKRGQLKWKTRISQPLSEPAVVTKEHILQSDESGTVHILRKDTGQLVSSQGQGQGWLSRPVFLDNRWAVLDGSGLCSVFTTE